MHEIFKLCEFLQIPSFIDCRIESIIFVKIAFYN